MRSRDTQVTSTYICDRCGHSVVHVDAVNTISGFPSDWTIVDFDSSTDKAKAYDLCAACSEAFVGFINREILVGAK